MTYQEKDDEAIKRVAELLCNGNTNIAQTLESEMREVISHKPGGFGAGSKSWVAALRSLGEIIVVIAKREEAKHRAMKL